jgi:hypothetical protein
MNDELRMKTKGLGMVAAMNDTGISVLTVREHYRFLIIFRGKLAE